MDIIKHAFEESGLGKAPFECINVVVRYNDAKQPGGICAHCMKAIVFCCIIRDAEGRKFEVGNVCVLKTDDSGLINVTERQVKQLQAAARRNKVNQRRADMFKDLTEKYEAFRPVLAKLPHPKLQNKTLADYYDFCIDMSGNYARTQWLTVAVNRGRELTANDLAHKLVTV